MAAEKFNHLRPVAAQVLQALGTDCQDPEVLCLLEDTIFRLESLVPAVQDGTIPAVGEITDILEKLQASEAELRQASGDLRNPARYHVPGELEAYLDLKHSLHAAIIGIELLETPIRRVRYVLAH